MKISALTLKNLNSLKGEWHIDFSCAPYSSSGIFAITGPTGAGKTTLFDAICLALYGQTPRLGKVSGQNNEIMTRHTNDCYAQAVFEEAGKKYIATWRQYRAGTDNQLQSPKHTLSEFEGAILTSRSDDTRKLVSKITGMDFKRFTQAMMLEQGGFDKFISSKKDDRAEILELITGTEIYGEISIRVFERAKHEKNKLSQQEVRLNDNRALIGDAKPEAVRAELEGLTTRRTELESQQAKTKLAKDWHREILRLEENLKFANDDIITQEKRMENIGPMLQELDAATRAESIAAIYSRLQEVRKSHAQSASECSRMSGTISQCRAAISHITDYVIPNAQAELSQVRGEVDEAPDLVLSRINSSVDEYERIMREIDTLTKKGAELERAHELSRREKNSALALRNKAQARMDEASRESAAAMDELIQARAKTTSAVLDEERSKLRPGEACPLCGSTEHPMIAHNPESVRRSEELFRLAERIDQRAKKCQAAYESALSDYHSADEKFNSAVIAENNARNQSDHNAEELRAKSEDRTRLHDEVSGAISLLRITGVRNTTDIKTRAKSWAERVKSLEKAITDHEAQKLRLEAQLEEAQKNFAVNNARLDTLTAELEELERGFTEALTGKNFADEKEFTDSLRDSERIEAMRSKQREITDRMTRLEALRARTEADLQEQSSLKVTDMTREDTEALFTQTESELGRVNARIAVLEQKQKDIQALADRVRELEEEYKAQKVVAANWEELRGLIGSAEGDKFRIFAQGVTLGLVVKNANLYLQKMNGRYTLITRPGSKDLELSVIDHEQAEEVRPTENLSGGERFIVSLALALGLSQIAGSKAHVDSLFLDEGFGSLDEASLSTALEALGEVQREGRMIGIISHISAIRERISAQINVIPKTEGVSVLEGPGCKRVK